MKKVGKLEEEVKLMKKERKLWAEYKEKKELVMRTASRKDKQVVHLPPVTTVVLQEEDTPTHSESAVEALTSLTIMIIFWYKPLIHRDTDSHRGIPSVDA
ncbi:hypothetical protein L6452_30670 [Arctium lappa]|uniref:Uncharacterized protein n=1 Tax=Arctium lappa TaxID=4217 RepID=A0ACB8ZID3_ARCLA|nr:hypothetical protein L6452_30670 [Arctium lappa]